MDFKQWRANIEADLVGLSDLSYQYACFSGRQASADSSPAEMIATIYDDDLLRDFVVEITGYEAHSAGLLLLEAIDALASGTDLSSADWKKIIESDEWSGVVGAAARLLEVLRRS